MQNVLCSRKYWLESYKCILTNIPPICRYVVIFVLWAIFFVMIYKVLTLEKDYIEYDPFEILQIDPVRS